MGAEITGPYLGDLSDEPLHEIGVAFWQSQLARLRDRNLNHAETARRVHALVFWPSMPAGEGGRVTAVLIF
jgi:hypothetical protein